MANNEINIPVALYHRMCQVVGADDYSVRSFALAIIQREVERLESATHRDQEDAERVTDQRPMTMAEWQVRRQDRPVLHIDFDAAAAIREERERREQEWYGRTES